MSDPLLGLTPFEARLARDLRAASSVAVRDVDGQVVADAVVARHPRANAGRPSWTTWGARSTRAAAVLMAVALIVVALLAVAFAGRDRSPLSHLAYIQAGEVFMADGDGRDPSRLTSALIEQRRVSSLRWHGSTLTFSETSLDGRHAWLGIASTSDRIIHLVAMPDGPTPGIDTWTATAPDGRSTATLSPTALAIRVPDGTSVRVPPPVGYAAWDTSDLASLDWAPDGTAVLVGACSIDPCFKSSSAELGPDRHDLFAVPVDGGTATRLSGPAAPAWHARFSPDGSLIAYQGCRYEGPEPVAAGCDDHGFDMGVMRPDGSARRTLIASPPDGWGNVGPALLWSDDAALVVVSTTPASGPSQLLAVDVRDAGVATTAIYSCCGADAWQSDPRWAMIAASDPTVPNPTLGPDAFSRLVGASDLVLEDLP